MAVLDMLAEIQSRSGALSTEKVNTTTGSDGTFHAQCVFVAGQSSVANDVEHQ